MVLMLAAALGLATGAARADDVRVTATIEPTTVAVGEQAALTVQVEGKFRRSAQPELPPLDDFDVYQAGTSQNFSIVNGQMSSSVVYSFVLRPKKEGTYKLAPITVTDGSKQYTANPVTLTVTSGAAAIQPPGSNAPPSGGASPGTQPPSDQVPGSNESIFVTASVDADTVYVNQQITWTLGYWADGRVNLLRSPNYTPPSAEGFWVEDLPPQKKYYSTLHGRQYLVSEIKRGFFPTAAGSYKIGAASVDIVVDDMSMGSVNDFLQRGLGGFGAARRLQTREIPIVVLPLPERGKPADFQGAVIRDLSLSISADKQVAQVGEPINVTVTMDGVGNMRTLMPPTLKNLKNFKVYESGSSTDSFKKDYVVSGKRKFEFVLIPETQGHFNLPPVKVSYFDPVKKTYATAQSEAIAMDVKPGAKEDGSKVVYAGGGDDFHVINKDIRYIHAPPATLTVAHAPFYLNRFFLALQALPLLAVGASLVVERRRRRFRQDVGFARSSRALRDADRRLAAAERVFRGGDGDGYGMIHAAVFGYFADKMNVPAAGLTGGTIDEFLHSHGAGEDAAKSVASAIAACDAARYAAGAAPADGASVARSAREALAAVERGLK